MSYEIMIGKIINGLRQIYSCSIHYALPQYYSEVDLSSLINRMYDSRNLRINLLRRKSRLPNSLVQVIRIINC